MKTLSILAIALIPSLLGQTLTKIYQWDNSFTTTADYTYYATGFAGDGNAWLERDGTGTGVANGTSFTISFWYDPEGLDATLSYIWANVSGRIRVVKTTGNAIQVVATDTSGTTEVDIEQNTGTVSALTAASGWSWIGIAVDNTTAGNCYIYIANSTTSWVATDCTTRNNDTGGSADLDFLQSDWAMGAAVGGSVPSDMEISEFYFSTTYYDLTSSANRDLFYDSTGNIPAGDLSATGSPIFYLANPYSTFITNTGSAGNMVKKGTTALTEGTAP